MSLPRHFFAPAFRYRKLGRFFAILVASLVFLATFAMIAESALSAATMTWDRGVSHRLTIELPAVSDESSMPQAERVKQVLALLHAMPDILSAVQVPESDSEQLLKPWFDQPELVKALPIPALIDVERKPDSILGADDIRDHIKAAAPDVRVDDHAVWLADLTHLVRALAALGGVMIGLTALTLVIAVSLLCRAIMASEQDAIALLHIMGAEDENIAGHFAWHAGILSGSASLAGFILAAATMAGLYVFVRHFADAGVVPLGYLVTLGACVVAVPIVATGIAVLAARVSILNYLGTMP